MQLLSPCPYLEMSASGGSGVLGPQQREPSRQEPVTSQGHRIPASKGAEGPLLGLPFKVLE